MTWEGFFFGLQLAGVIFVWTLVACLAVDLHRWLWHRERRGRYQGPSSGRHKQDPKQEPMQKRIPQRMHMVGRASQQLDPLRSHRAVALCGLLIRHEQIAPAALPARVTCRRCLERM